MKVYIDYSREPVGQVRIVHNGSHKVFNFITGGISDPWANRVEIEIADVMEIDNLIFSLTQARKYFTEEYTIKESGQK